LRITLGGGLGTSLGVVLVAQGAKLVDLDRPLFLASDRVPGLRYEGSTICPVGRIVGWSWVMAGHELILSQL
jgi:hypothetical protein